MRIPVLFVLVISAPFAGLAGAQASSATPAAAAPPAAVSTACPPLLRHTFARLQDEKPQPLCQYAGRVLLVVNTASYCGFTPQYRGLEALHNRYKDAGLVVLGFPSNDFLQEKSSNREIADFCESTFGVRFPMFAASSVRGADANPLFRQLAERAGQAPRWNFHKYLIARDGSVVGSWGATTAPESAELVQAVEQQLRRR